ncbi:MAG: ORF6N domain-containing protein [Candidatus Omnitrophica bacterium]|nr:ORF6N domain-containing protein [Candidatus Omnitrophota bacterium]
MDEFINLKCQFGISSWGGTRKLPYAFTEQGVAMLSSVLRSKRAAQVNIAIMRAFVKLRQILSVNKELACKLSELEHKIEKHDTDIQAIFTAIRQLMMPPEKPKRKIGFVPR